MSAPDPGTNRPDPRGDERWERWQKLVIQLLVLALKIISAVAIVVIFAIAEYAAVMKVAHALAQEPAYAQQPVPRSDAGLPVCGCCNPQSRTTCRMCRNRIQKKAAVTARSP
jgi:hypothetical protein